jgi:hypothetical protein
MIKMNYPHYLWFKDLCDETKPIPNVDRLVSPSIDEKIEPIPLRRSARIRAKQIISDSKVNTNDEKKNNRK